MKPALFALFALSALAQPRIQNARLEQRAVSGSLDATVRGIVSAQAAPVWIGYAAPQIPGERQMCCWNTTNNVTCQGCSLEPQVTQPGFPQQAAPVRLEGATEFYVLLRAEDRKVSKIRQFSIDCNIDAGGLPVYWITGVTAAQSIALLESLMPAAAPTFDGRGFDARDERRLTDSAISAIALHRDPAADAALDRLTDRTRPEETRRQAAFWLGNARGRHGYDSLVRVLRDDPSDRVREHAIFALTQSKETEAIPTILRAARDDKSAQVRGQALFWLAQRAGRQISEEAIRNAIEQDADTAVKKKAVFALTQIPNGDGVPMLIDVARRNKNDAVRREAMNWLGRSKDSRALQFFEDVLTK
jgi:HEAT repeat protein